MKNQNRWLLALICLFLILSACSPRVTPSGLTAMIPDKTSTAAPVTPTNSPTVFPEATEIPFVMPTSTFMAPTPVAGLRYRLTHWTPQLANNLIETLRKYPDQLGFQNLDHHYRAYQASYRFAAFAERETRLYFPNPSFGEVWAWDASYSMAQYGDDETLPSYATLIGSALNTGKTNISTLPSWFAQHETRLALKVFPFESKLESYVLEIGNSGYGGFLWVVRNGATFSVSPFGDFQVEALDGGLSLDFKDVMGDGIAEIITTYQYAPASVDARAAIFGVFDVSSGTPERLFDPNISFGSWATWSALEENKRAVGMAFDFNFGTVVCPVPFHDEYRWDGQRFNRTLETHPSVQEIKDQYGGECLDMFGSHQILDELHSGSAHALQVWDDFIADWPHFSYFAVYELWPLGDEKSPASSRDKARFTAAIRLASDGFVDAARHEMSLIIEKPVVPNSGWIDPAKIFLANFKTQADMRQTCLAIQLCAQFMNVDTLINLAGTENPQDIINFLQQTGVEISKSGAMDINNDGQIDQWIIVDQAGWMLISSKNGYQLVLLGYGLKSLKMEPAFQGTPVFQVARDYGDGSTEVEVDLLQTDPETLKMDTSLLCDSLSSDVDDLQNNLLSGWHPSEAIKKLLPLLPEMELECKSDHYALAQARYLLAVAYDLCDDSTHAIENYRIVWQSYPDAGPYSLMAQAKLEVAP